MAAACGVKPIVEREREVSLEYATLIASEPSLVAWMVMEPQVCVRGTTLN